MAKIILKLMIIKNFLFYSIKRNYYLKRFVQGKQLKRKDAVRCVQLSVLIFNLYLFPKCYCSPETKL